MIAISKSIITLAKKRHKAEIIFVKYKHLKQVFLFQVVSVIEITSVPLKRDDY